MFLIKKTKFYNTLIIIMSLSDQFSLLLLLQILQFTTLCSVDVMQRSE